MLRSGRLRVWLEQRGRRHCSLRGHGARRLKHGDAARRCFSFFVLGDLGRIQLECDSSVVSSEQGPDVQHWCRSCHNCQVNGNKKLLYGPRQAVIANGPFEKWGIDAMGPLPRTANGKLYILVAIDYMTRFGTPLEIVSDNGPGFRRGLLTEVCEELKISHRHSTPYYPQSNGLVEKANGIIAGIIRKMVESKPKHWDNFLDGAIWAYRTTYRDATQFTPFHLVYG
ncbi:hypothetical protein L7F22_032345 [Adiantum nelumboides]|nr:hypothetical protein [Adiantum nelumboides]